MIKGTGVLSEGPSFVLELCLLRRLEQQRFASFDSDERRVRHTTVLCVRKDNTVVIMADGQVTQGSQIIKPNVKKVRRITDGVIGGFAGAYYRGTSSGSFRNDCNA